MTDKQNPAVGWSFDLPRTPVAGLIKALNFYAAKIAPATPPRSGPLLAPRTVSQSSQLGVADEIAKLGKLRDQGLLTEGEFNAQKLKLLGSP
jgi:hypothetical protein